MFFVGPGNSLIRSGSPFWPSMGPSSRFWSRFGGIWVFGLTLGFYFPENTISETYFVISATNLFFWAFSQLRLEKLVWPNPVSGKVASLKARLCMRIVQNMFFGPVWEIPILEPGCLFSGNLTFWLSTLFNQGGCRCLSGLILACFICVK